MRSQLPLKLYQSSISSIDEAIENLKRADMLVLNLQPISLFTGSTLKMAVNKIAVTRSLTPGLLLIIARPEPYSVVESD